MTAVDDETGEVCELAGILELVRCPTTCLALLSALASWVAVFLELLGSAYGKHAVDVAITLCVLTFVWAVHDTRA